MDGQVLGKTISDESVPAAGSEELAGIPDEATAESVQAHVGPQDLDLGRDEEEFSELGALRGEALFLNEATRPMTSEYPQTCKIVSFLLCFCSTFGVASLLSWLVWRHIHQAVPGGWDRKAMAPALLATTSSLSPTSSWSRAASGDKHQQGVLPSMLAATPSLPPARPLSTTKTGAWYSTVVPPPPVYIFQFGDAAAIEKYDTWIGTVQQAAQRNAGFRYTLRTDIKITSEHCVGPCANGFLAVIKPLVIEQEMKTLASSGIEVAWFVYLDLDIAIADHSRFGQLLGNLSSLDVEALQSKGHCQFVAQESCETLNSGFLAFQHPFHTGSFSHNLLRAWASEVEQIRPWGSWVGDQGPLQSAILKLALNTGGPSSRRRYRNECNIIPDVFARNKCWNRMMSTLGLTADHRSFGSYCLLSHMHRWNMHDCGDHFRQGDLLYHGKDEAMVEKLQGEAGHSVRGHGRALRAGWSHCDHSVWSLEFPDWGLRMGASMQLPRDGPRVD